MLRDPRRLRLPGTLLPGAFLLPVVLFSTLLALQGPGSVSPAPVLLIVAPGSKLAAVERTRAAVRAPRHALLVAESDRVVLEGGFEVLVDRSFSRAPAADLVVLVDGNPGRAEESFLMDRKKTAKAILLPPGSPLAERLRGEGSGGALILLGASDSVAALLDALGAPTALPPDTGGAVAPTPSPPPRVASVPPSRTATPSSSRVFDRYFSSSAPAPSPTPR